MSKYLQTATYWAPSTLNEYGERSYSAPVAINVRWEEKTEEFIDKPTGKEQQSHSIVYSESDVVEDGFLFLGASVSSTPKDVAGAFPIRRFDKSPTLKANRYIRKIWL